MYCPSCGKETPEQSTYCLHCGERIAVPRPPDDLKSRKPPVEWEHKDFVLEYPPESRGKVFIGPGGYTIPGGRLFFWQSEQATIAKKLQRWLDEGWEPVGEVGPACYKIRTYRKWKPDALTWILGILSLGILLLVGYANPAHWYEYMEATEFRLPMRRSKQHRKGL